MSSNQRPNPNVGVGTLREPDEKEYTVNEGWDFFQKHMPDDSVMDSENFSIECNDIKSNGPYVFQIPKYPECFLDPTSLRLQGKCKLVWKKGTVVQDALPKEANKSKDPWRTDTTYKFTEAPNGDTTLKSLKNVGDVASRGIIEVGAGDNLATKYYIQLSAYHNYYTDKCAKVVPENLMCQAMWKDVEVKINGYQVTKNANLEYAHKAYLETILSYGKDALDSHMTAEMWSPDMSNEIADKLGNPTFEQEYKTTKSFHQKRRRYSMDKYFTFSMQLHTELNSINGFLPDNLGYTFKFSRNDPKFFLRTTSGTDEEVDETGGYYDVLFEELKLVGTFMRPSPKVMSAFKSFIAKNDAVYKTVRTSILTKGIDKDQTQFSFNNMFASDKLPDQIFVALVDQSAKTGRYGKSPFYFHHFDVSNVRLQVNNKNYPVEALTPDFANNQYAKAYRHLFENTSIKTNNIGLCITPLDFKYGSTIWAWDLNHDGCAGAHSNHSDMFGAASLHLLFKKGLPANVTCIVAAVYRDYLAIDQWGRPDVISSHGVAQLFQNKMDLS